MPDDPRVQELLDRLSASDATPEQVCGSCVELLPTVRDRWRQMRRMREELDDLFPPEEGPDEGSAWEQMGDAPLPAVPGYEIEAELGRGGMGVVYRARHVRLNRVIALKMVPAGGPREHERFRREAEAAGALRHPNVVQVHDVGDAGGRLYFTMEYVEGGSLARKLDGNPLPIREAAGLLLALSGAVGAAHKAGIVHRDLKPANVLLTSDGTPKIADFGLARRLDGEAGLTRTGTAVGTPSYMAPEQAGEYKSAPGPPADIYSLGAILYELLTGRPPFQAATAAVTIYRATTQDPVPPSRLNGKVPRDLETICMTCLRKESRLRYQSATALGDDLRRFLDGEAIAARPEGPLARLARRVRRRPLLSAAVAVAVLSTGALVVGGAWAVTAQRAAKRAADLKQAAADAVLKATERAAESDLKEMEGALQRSAWIEAHAALERARGRIGERASIVIRSRMARGEQDLRLHRRIDAILLARAGTVIAENDSQRFEGEYEAALREGEIGRVDGSVGVVADRICVSNVRRDLIAALDDWAVCTTSPTRRDWLFAVARAADPDPQGWRERARDSKVWQDAKALAEIARDAPADDPCVPLLLALERQLLLTGQDSLPFVVRIQRAHPRNVCVALRAGVLATHRGDRMEALRYFQAAVTLRPDSAITNNYMAGTLANVGRNQEAIEYFQLAEKLDPTSGAFIANRAISLVRLGRRDDAERILRAAIQNHPKAAALRSALAELLEIQGRIDEAVAEHREAVAAEPNSLFTLRRMCHSLIRFGRPREARVTWGQSLETNPSDHDRWYGYAEFCLYLGDEAEYHRARTALLGKFGQTTAPHIAERTARAALLAPANGSELERAAALAMFVASLDRQKLLWEYPFYQFVRGLAEYRQGKFGQAISTLRGDARHRPGPTPQLVPAMALQRDGQDAEARKTLAAALLNYDWRTDEIHDQDGWITHVLRREAEMLIIGR